MVRVNNKTSGLLPFFPRSISNSSSKDQTCFINADICWSWFRSWIYGFQVIKNIGRRFSFVKFCPSNYNTTRSNNSFNTVWASSTEEVFLDMFLIFLIMSLMRVILWILPRLEFLRSLKHSSYSHEIITMTICLLMLFPQRLVNYTRFSILNSGLYAVPDTTTFSKDNFIMRTKGTSTWIG